MYIIAMLKKKIQSNIYQQPSCLYIISPYYLNCSVKQGQLSDPEKT